MEEDRISRLRETFQELVALPGLSSDEGQVAHYIQEQVAGCADETFVDTVGNLYAIRRGSPDMPSVMFAAHMDEIGLMVSRIEENGFVRFIKVGFPDERLLAGRKVRVGDAIGVIGNKDIHVQTLEEQAKLIQPNELFIDVGAGSITAVKAMGIKVGTPVTFISEFFELGRGGNVVASKAADDRVACAILMETLRDLKAVEVPGNVYAVFTAQEEVGLRGARQAAYRLNPTFAISVDIALAADTPYYPPLTEDSVRLGGGPVIALREEITTTLRGMIIHPVVLRYLLHCAERADIKCQHYMMFPSGMTDAVEITAVREGIPAAYVGVPTRYTHSPVEVVDLRDVRQTTDLLKESVVNVTSDMDFRPY